MRKSIIIFMILTITLLVILPIINNKDLVITKIEENSNLMVSINYPHTKIKTLDHLITNYVNKAYNDFKKENSNSSLTELNIDFDYLTINDIYEIVTLKAYKVNYTLNKSFNDIYTVIFNKKTKQLMNINDFIDSKLITLFIQKKLMNEYADCINIDTLSNLKINHSFAFDDENINIYYQTSTCGLISTTIPSFLSLITIDKKYNSSLPFSLIDYDIDINKPVVALTFDDGPSKYTKAIIEYLHEEEAYGTFFVLGNKVKSYNQTLNRMIGYGNEIGNHTFNHRWLSRLSNEEIKKQINKTQDIIKNVTGYTPKVLRPTYGSISKRITNNTSLKVILWDIDTMDWRIKSSSKIAKRVLSKDCDGKVILFHDTYERTLKALKIIIPELKEKGYQFVTVSDLVNVQYLRKINEQDD